MHASARSQLPFSYDRNPSIRVCPGAFGTETALSRTKIALNIGPKLLHTLRSSPFLFVKTVSVNEDSSSDIDSEILDNNGSGPLVKIGAIMGTGDTRSKNAFGSNPETTYQKGH